MLEELKHLTNSANMVNRPQGVIELDPYTIYTIAPAHVL